MSIERMIEDEHERIVHPKNETRWLRVLMAKDELGRKIQVIIHPPQDELGAVQDVIKLLEKNNPTDHKLQFVVYKAYYAEVMADGETPTGQVSMENPELSRRSH